MSPLPSFRKPPVTEVVIASRFKSPSDYSVLKVAEFASRLAEAGFTRIEEMPGYEAITEQFGLAQGQSSISFEFLTGPPPVRYWFLNALGDELVQLQPNWFAANWRKVSPTADYVRWDARSEAFSQWIQAAEGVLSEQPLEHDQVEVTYVNHIESGEPWFSHSAADRVFSFLSSNSSSASFLPSAEGVSAELKFEIKTPRSTGPIGGLHVTVTPAFRRPGGEPIFVMNLTARGRPSSGDLSGVREFAETAHEWIVRGFTELTTTAMHEVWQRTS